MARFQSQTISLKDGRSVVLRHCEPGDSPLMPVFMSRVARESTNTLQYEGREYSIERIARVWRDALDPPGVLYLGAFDGARLVGDIAIRRLSEDHPWVRHVAEFGMMVLEEYWGQGLGTRLLLEAEACMRAIGVTRIEAKVRTLNERGIGLYRKLGYEIEGTRRRAALVEGRYLDEYYIAKLLS